MTDMTEEENFIGKEFAGCKIISKIGQGGMGTVYKAHHKALDKVVCVKLLAKELSSDKRNLEFFLREARSAAKLNHPNIVHVYNFGKENNNYFIVMSFIDGKSLQEIVEEDGPLPTDKAVKFTVELLEGLGHAHSKGVIHRDIKPSNILVGANGQSYLVDFGLAKSVSEEKELTQAGEMIGTAYFMSPEQCLAQKVDNRADLYAVGATFYYLITGKYPFEGKTSIEVMHKHIGTSVPDPILVNPDVPRWANVFIEHSMKKKPEARYQTADEAKTDLLDYSSGKKLLPNPGGDIILDLSSKLHNPEESEIFDNAVMGGGASISIGNSLDPAAETESGNDSKFSPFSRNDGLNVDWESGEALPPSLAVPPQPPAFSRDGDPSMDISAGIDKNPGGNSSMYAFAGKKTPLSDMMTDAYVPVEDPDPVKEDERQDPHLSETRSGHVQKKSGVPAASNIVQHVIKSLSCFALLIAGSFFLMLAGAAGTGEPSLSNAFSTNPSMAAGLAAAGLIILGFSFLLRPAKTPVSYMLLVVLGAMSAFAGGAYISSGSDIPSKLLQSVSMITQNTASHLMSVYAVSLFIAAFFLTSFSSKFLKIIGAVLSVFSIWLVFCYARIGHVFFGIDAWGIVALVCALFAFFFAITAEKPKMFGQTFFVIAASIAAVMMIYVSNVNRSAENEYQKISKQWEVFKAAQQTEGYAASKDLEPEEQLRDLYDIKEDEKDNYIQKEKEKFAYAVTDGGGFIVFSFFMSLISMLCLFKKENASPAEEIY